jgi:hypothetical protein
MILPSNDSLMYMENGVNVYNQSGVLGPALLTLLALAEVVWDGPWFFFLFLNCRYTRLMNPSCF